jgi:FkbM family methyltransferase
MLIDPVRISTLLQEYNISIKGILHVGAHECEEKQTYNSVWNVKDETILWIDANSDLVEKNKRNGILNCYTAVLDETEHDAVFHITNNGQSSSLLEFGTHATSYSWCVVTENRTVRTQTLNQFFQKNSLNPANYNVWNFDIQGVELQVMRGSKELLQHADLIYSEVNTDDVYKGCGKLNEVDLLLAEHGFKRVILEMTDKQWGDAVYIRVNSKVKPTLCFDIGANKGLWALANKNNYSKIIAIEPIDNTFSILTENCKDSMFTCLKYAVCDSSDEFITFYDCEFDTLSTLCKEWLTDPSSRFCGSKYKEIQCKTITIDTLINTYGIPDLIKVDAESGEFKCIKSLTQKVPLICFEWASETPTITNQCIDYLYSLGFREFHIQTEDNYIYRPVNYTTIDAVKESISAMIPKQDWGMLWCR